MHKGLNIRTTEHLLKCLKEREAIEGPRVGDFILRKNGALERLCVQSVDSFQSYENGSYCLHSSGTVSYSGTCGDVIKRENIKEWYYFFDDFTGAKGFSGQFWICYNGYLTGNCSVIVNLECRMYKEI